MLISTLTTSFLTGVEQNPAVPPGLSDRAAVELSSGVPFISDADLGAALQKVDVPAATAATIVDANATARLDGLRSALSVLAVFALLALFFTRRIPNEPLAAASPASAASPP